VAASRPGRALPSNRPRALPRRRTRNRAPGARGRSPGAGGRPADPGFWAGASFVPDNLAMSSAPVTFGLTGRAVAVIGTIGERCCFDGHAQV